VNDLTRTWTVFPQGSGPSEEFAWSLFDKSLKDFFYFVRPNCYFHWRAVPFVRKAVPWADEGSIEFTVVGRLLVCETDGCGWPKAKPEFPYVD
jgi:hypothetical protein